MRSLVPRVAPLLLALPPLLVGAHARADLIDPAEEACGEPGDRCTLDGKEGACVKSKCSKLVYGAPPVGPDGKAVDDSTPTTREYDCAKCVPGAAPSEAAAKGKGSSCTVEPTSTTTTSLLLGLGLLGLVAARRRG